VFEFRRTHVLILLVTALFILGPQHLPEAAAPIAEVAATAANGLVAAGGAVAIAKGIEPAVQAAMSHTPNPNVEGTDAAKISDELADRGLPELKYPKQQLQSHYKHAKDFGVDQNLSSGNNPRHNGSHNDQIGGAGGARTRGQGI
jgi:hypothetical protein